MKYIITNFVNWIYNTHQYSTGGAPILLKYLPKDVVPTTFVAHYTDFSREKFLQVKKLYANMAGIYMWYNKVNGKTYVGVLGEPAAKPALLILSVDWRIT